MSFGGFSWKRALGIIGAKQKIERATGISTTKAGRKRKDERMLRDAIFGSPKKKRRK